jgi:hypothetical protein
VGRQRRRGGGGDPTCVGGREGSTRQPTGDAAREAREGPARRGGRSCHGWRLQSTEGSSGATI